MSENFKIVEIKNDKKDFYSFYSSAMNRKR